jgi:hypothetical protein
MNNWTTKELAFRCDRLSLRMERLAQNFLRMGSMSLDGVDAETVRAIVKESKIFVENRSLDRLVR